MREPDGYVVCVDHVANRVQVADSVGGLPGPWRPFSAYVPVDPLRAPLTSLGAPVWRTANATAAAKPCTCGVKFTGGLCSSWCDSLRPDEPVPDTEPRYDGGLMSWLPQGAVFYSPFGSTSLHPTQPARAPAKLKPQPTPFGDGTNALDEVCVCGGYIMRPGKVYRAADNSMHGTRVCLDKHSNWHSAPPKP